VVKGQMANRYCFRTAARIISVTLISLLAATASGFKISAATTADDFHVRTTEDLVSLCSADPADENYVAAIHFCHGFTVGAYRYYQAIAVASPNDRYVCPPDPPPSRSEAIREFVAWTHRNPSVLKESPVDSMFRFLSQRFPCRS
jgi:hypothetical protein